MEGAGRRPHALNFTKGSRTVGHVIEHVIHHDDIERRVRERQSLSVRERVFRAVAKRHASRLEHPV
jgi:hypothetical protein